MNKVSTDKKPKNPIMRLSVRISAKYAFLLLSTPFQLRLLLLNWLSDRTLSNPPPEEKQTC